MLWLENFLKEYKGAVFLISHDRQFLDNIVSKTLHLHGGDLMSYAGNYSFYIRERKAWEQRLIKEHQKQQQHIKKTEEFIRRNIAGQKTKQAQSRRKQLEKLEKVNLFSNEHTTDFFFNIDSSSGRFVATVKNLCFSYNHIPIFNDINFNIERNDKVGLVGPNGCGKTTLLNLLAQKLSPDKGEIIIGHNVQISYFSQQRDDLTPSNTVIEEIWSVKPGWKEGQVRAYMAKFLFTQDDVFNHISSLSGGEQSRLALAKLILGKSNFIILDEPTNHLDIKSKEVLEDALQDYPGTLLVVSHDRYFLNKITNKTIALKNGNARTFLGDFDYYQQKIAEERWEKEQKQKRVEKSTKTKTKPTKSIVKKIKDQISQVEQSIFETEEQIKSLEAELCKEEVYKNHKKNLDVNKKYEAQKEKLSYLFSRWEELEDQLSKTVAQD
ncbi:ABC-F family ATP-binding cassette domain-containing protein [Proteinivorax tanatarense]|uniref:ABC-F family ATP-binding cassette domain-containing protein n=1 Tax=Proteinivorax tanatarense TaxID=1260629 RepID=UPI003D9C7861